MAPIVIVTPPLPASAEHRDALEEGCRRAAHTPCRATSAEPEGPFVRAVWLDGDTARIELRHSDADAFLEERVLHFRASDPEVERWETLGVVAAALAVSSPAARSAESERPPRVGPRGWLGLGAGGGISGEFHLGAVADAGVNLGVIPLELSASAAYASGPEFAERIRVQWLGISAALGTSVRWSEPQVLLRGRMGPRLQRVEAVLHSAWVPVSHTAGEDRGVRWLLGFAGALDAYWPAASPFAGWVGIEGWQNGGGTALLVDGLRVDSIPAWGASARIGLVWQFGAAPSL